MLWACAYINGKESGSLASDNVVGSVDDYCRFNEIVDLDVAGSSWVYWDVDNLFGTFCERDSVVHQNHGWDKVLIWCKEGGGVPGVIVEI